MKFNSTRSNGIKVESAQAIKTGLAGDGGLYVPEDFPQISLREIEDMKDMPYTFKAVNILKRYLTDFTEDEIAGCVEKAYSNGKWDDPAVTPLKNLNGKAFILELWHGATCAFKDVALQILPHLLTESIRKTSDTRTAVILVATSGDTGKAALEGFKDVPGTKICVFYPSEGVSDIQKLQMTTQQGNNIAVCGIQGNFDDAQTGVKKIFTDSGFNDKLDKKGMMFSSANSINWGRLVPQIVYYFSAYCDLLKSGEIAIGEKINFVVPTGNFGNILAGYYAKKMGLPVNKLICASNKNNVLTDFINTGTYDKNRQFYTTSSPSMDILISSNLERFVYDVCGKDDETVKAFMQSLSSKGSYSVDAETKEKIGEILWGGFCGDEDAAACINDTFERYEYVMDTHTAVGKRVYDKYLDETGDSSKTVILSTASPFKFGKSVIEALKGSGACGSKNEFELLDMLSSISGLKIPPSLSGLKSMPVRFSGTIDKDDMPGFVDGTI